jgi:hypothetical protein
MVQASTHCPAGSLHALPGSQRDVTRPLPSSVQTWRMPASFESQRLLPGWHATGAQVALPFDAVQNVPGPQGDVSQSVPVALHTAVLPSEQRLVPGVQIWQKPS